MSEQCVARVWDQASWHNHQCQRNGKIKVAGKWYCTQHDPLAKAKRHQEREAKWDAEQKECDRLDKRDRLIEAAGIKELTDGELRRIKKLGGIKALLGEASNA